MYQVGETIRLKATITNIAGSAVDPTTVVIAINKPDRTAGVGSADMDKEEVGVYFYDFDIPEGTGTYQYNVTAVGSAGRVTIVRDNFKVEIPK